MGTESIKQKGFSVLEWSFKKDYQPTKKSEPVYNFLKRTMNKQDTEKQKTKHVTAKFIHDFFMKHNSTKIKLLCMPGITWDFEKNLRKRLRLYHKHHRIKLIVTGCELDYKIFCLSAAKMPGNEKDKRSPYFSDNLGAYVVTNLGNQTYLLNADIFDVISRPNNNGIKYDVVWFDTTNTVISIARKLNDFSTQMADNSILIFTVLKGREHVKFETNRTDFLSEKLLPMGYTLQKQIEYFDSSPMLHLIYAKTI